MQNVSNAEFEVLEALWAAGEPVPASTVVEHLNQQKPWHEKTVKTLLNRLVNKGCVGFEKDQRRYLYQPLLDRDSYVRTESKGLLDKLFGGRLSPLVAGFAKDKALSREDIDALKRLIDNWEQDHD
ncbi:BlaI/MecI/CopY family transcriptional regulator [Gallaecimonas kandeliae]|uniref:BlaI/MecI/CopY family transcriptional regulator n=1 Tax=Gallaecimonas kandeliae TaxID=3029055 RepID=UPI00264A3325|nr:BlaI/MecI/CopY family transcriptional regulator [Gallaecimonas kandeliae]WKE65092.1 BlaI/MecI/CopY family transcriptional regulator [Gallaecimonas kandeliae]